jgi:hypothetical protein
VATSYIDYGDDEERVGWCWLRVVDVGVFPMSVAGHSSSSVYAVAEKVSFTFVDAVWEVRYMESDC